MASNGTFVKLKKGDNIRTFFLFIDGDARELTKHGWSNVITDFNKVYNDLIADGYEEIEGVLRWV